MADWNQTQYQGISPGLLQQLVNMPSKSAAGLNAFTQGMFGGSGNQSAGASLQQILQKNQQQQTMQQIMKMLGQGGQQSMMQQPGAGMPNPMQSAMGSQTTMMNDPLGILGGQ